MATEAQSGGYPPRITRDPRFVAGRTLVQSGQAKNGAIEIFATLVEESTARHGNSSLETAACYYEYGNALFRAMTASSEVEEEEQRREDEKEVASKKAAAAAAEAAGRRLEREGVGTICDAGPKEDGDLKPAAKETPTESSPDNKENQEEDDVTLALEMMENAWSVLDKITSESPSNDWIEEQLPRILIGIGDVLLELKRFGDAVDVYTRALPYREAALQKLKDTKEPSLEQLRARRQLTETNVLIAETILACSEGEDIVTTETKDTLVEASERENYAQGYYDKACEDLQETVLCLGRVATKSDTQEFKREKENVCFVATMLMGVGEQLAEIGERKEELMNSTTPPKKKAKR